MTTIDEILSFLAKAVRENTPISASQWLNYASQLNVMMMELEDELVKAEMAYNSNLSKSITENPEESVSRLKLIAKGSDEYKNFITLKAKKENVIEFVRLAKKRTELQAWDR